MSDSEGGSNVMVTWYRNRIADPNTDDEVYGYWVFVFGILLGILGIVLYMTNLDARGSTPAGAGIALSAIALVLLMVGPVIRLPLRKNANRVSYLGALIAFVGVVWFFAEFPNFVESDAATLVMLVYALGIALIAGGAALVPMLSRKVEREPIETEPATVEEPEPVEEPAESKARFEVYEDRGGEWRWRLRHDNGNIIADGGEGYSSRQKAQQGLESVKRNAGGAEVVREEPEAEVEGEPEQAEDAPYSAAESQGTFEVYEDAGGEYRWRLVHDNGEIIADSGEGYSSRSAAHDAVERVQDRVGDAEYLRIDPTAFEVYEDAGGEWRWRLVHRNGNILGDSGEGYASRSNARRAISSVRERVGDDDAFEVYEDAASEYRWRLVADNDEILADSGGDYASKRGAEKAVERVREYAPEAHALDYSGPIFELYEDAAMEFRWRLRTANGEIIGDGGEGYASRTGAKNGIHSVKRNAPNADVSDADLEDEETEE